MNAAYSLHRAIETEVFTLATSIFATITTDFTLDLEHDGMNNVDDEFRTHITEFLLLQRSLQ
jgi:hypothetical protein